QWGGVGLKGSESRMCRWKSRAIQTDGAMGEDANARGAKTGSAKSDDAKADGATSGDAKAGGGAG
ncbi:MAG: hypothetical protein ACREP7_02060, partial [Lysobacter sp.]